MNRTILVPIDISDSELTQRVISHVEAEAKIDRDKNRSVHKTSCFSIRIKCNAR